LTESDLKRRVLGCGDGPASFNAEAAARGRRIVSCDPLYVLDADQIRRAFERSAGPIISQVKANPANYVWSYHANPDQLLARRQSVLQTFLLDYPVGLRQGRYVVGALPRLPFADMQFDLSVCSHFLFLYSAMLDLDFHIKSVQEM